MLIIQESKDISTDATLNGFKEMRPSDYDKPAKSAFINDHFSMPEDFDVALYLVLNLDVSSELSAQNADVALDGILILVKKYFEMKDGPAGHSYRYL